MNEYESVIILKSNLSEEKLNEIISKVENKIKEFATITAKKDIGIRKLAYEIKHNKEGHYFIYQLDLKVDERLLRIRQFTKKGLLNNCYTHLEIEKLAKMIKVKPLYLWKEKELNKIGNIKADDIIKILTEYEAINKFIPEITNQNEIRYILRNLDKIHNYSSLKDMKDDIENIDNYWIKLKKELNFSNEVIEKYKGNIVDFLLNSGSELAYGYYLNCSYEHKKAFKLIIKAQIMGEFRRLKYHTDDLKRELDYELSNAQIREWTENNIRIETGKYEIGEYDDFYHTMILGEYPQHTCLSYINGMYNKCLLACFDSNKKILYAKLNGKIVARAMIRLTKGTFSKARINKKELNFIDVEYEKQNSKDEYLTLFLERIYTSGITKQEEKTISKAFIKLLKEKAKSINALLVLNYRYGSVIDEQFKEKEYYMYISKSKASVQYLDSLSGEATVESEGQYRANYFWICKQIEEEQGVKESIF